MKACRTNKLNPAETCAQLIRFIREPERFILGILLDISILRKPHRHEPGLDIPKADGGGIKAKTLILFFFSLFFFAIFFAFVSCRHVVSNVLLNYVLLLNRKISHDEKTDVWRWVFKGFLGVASNWSVNRTRTVFSITFVARRRHVNRMKRDRNLVSWLSGRWCYYVVVASGLIVSFRSQSVPLNETHRSAKSSSRNLRVDIFKTTVSKHVCFYRSPGLS